MLAAALLQVGAGTGTGGAAVQGLTNVFKSLQDDVVE
jgi:hypothetical protein